MAVGLSLMTKAGERLDMPGWRLILGSNPCLVKDMHQISLQGVRFDETFTSEQLAEIRRQYEAVESL